jgi:ABC-2 type transport system permease protein
MAWAVLPPLVISLLEKFFFSSNHFAQLLGERFTGVMPLAFDSSMSQDWASDSGGEVVAHMPGLEVINIGPLLASPGLWLGLVVAAAFVAGAVYLRRYQDEST